MVHKNGKRRGRDFSETYQRPLLRYDWFPPQPFLSLSLMSQLRSLKRSHLLSAHLKSLPPLPQTVQMEEIVLKGSRCPIVAEGCKGLNKSQRSQKRGNIQAKAIFILRLFFGEFFCHDFGFMLSC